MATEKLNVKIGADISDLSNKLGLATNKLGNFRAAAARLGKVLATSLVAGITAVGTAAFVSATKLGKTADRLLDLQQITGLSTKTLQEFENVARVAGVSSEALAGAAEGLTRRLRAAGTADKTFTDNIAALGVNVQDATGHLRSMDDLVPEIITRLAGMQNITERNALGAQIFGRRFSELAPVLSLGADGIKAATDQAREMGQVLSKDALNAANNFRITMEQLRAKLDLAWRSIVVSLLPAFQKLAAFVDSTVVPVIQTAAYNISQYISGIADALNEPVDALGNLDQRLQPFFTFIVKVKAGFEILTSTIDILGLKINLLPDTLATALRKAAEALKNAPEYVLKALNLSTDIKAEGGGSGGSSGGRTGPSFADRQRAALAGAQAKLDNAVYNFTFPAEAAAKLASGLGQAMTSAGSSGGKTLQQWLASLGVAAGDAAGALGDGATAARDWAAALDESIRQNRQRLNASLANAPAGVNQGGIGTPARPLAAPNVSVTVPPARDLATPDVTAFVNRPLWRQGFLNQVEVGRRLRSLVMAVGRTAIQTAEDIKGNVDAYNRGQREAVIRNMDFGRRLRGVVIQVATNLGNVIGERIQAARDASTLQADPQVTQNIRRVAQIIRTRWALFVQGVGENLDQALAATLDPRKDYGGSYTRRMQDRQGSDRAQLKDAGRINRQRGPISAPDAFSDAALQIASQLPILGNAITAFVSGGPMAALAAFVADLLQSAEGFRDVIKLVTDSFKPVVDAVDSVLTALMPLIEPLLSLNQVLAPFIEIAAKLLTPVARVLGFVLEGLAKIVTGIVNVFIDIYNFLLGWLFGKVKRIGSSQGGGTGASDAGTFGNGPSSTTYNPAVSLAVSGSNTGPVIGRQQLDATQMMLDAGKLQKAAGLTFDRAVDKLLQALQSDYGFTRALGPA